MPEGLVSVGLGMLAGALIGAGIILLVKYYDRRRKRKKGYWING